MQENLSAAGAPSLTLLGELTALPEARSRWGGASCPLLENPTPEPALALWVSSFGPRPWPEMGGLASSNMMG